MHFVENHAERHMSALESTCRRSLLERPERTYAGRAGGLLVVSSSSSGLDNVGGAIEVKERDGPRVEKRVSGLTWIRLMGRPRRMSIKSSKLEGD